MPDASDAVAYCPEVIKRFNLYVDCCRGCHADIDHGDDDYIEYLYRGERFLLCCAVTEALDKHIGRWEAE